jgi:hypothetical protein
VLLHLFVVLHSYITEFWRLLSNPEELTSQ